MVAGELAPPIGIVAEMLREPRRPIERTEATAHELVRALLSRRAVFGITRVGCITRLDRIGIPVVQVSRPLSLSNAVSQGKGLSVAQAAASALMEELEVWAAESIPTQRMHQASAREQGDDICLLYKDWVPEGVGAEWRLEPLAWLDSWDLFTSRTIPVPAALVDTVYTLPSPHPAFFPRTTTGLGAGRTLVEAIVHAGLEILERDAIARAYDRPHFFDAHRIATDAVRGRASGPILDRIRNAGMLVGIWQVPTNHHLPVFWCHLMEMKDSSELAPLPAQGFGCDVSHDKALTRALLEACQARLSAISGAREDITRDSYPTSYDRLHLDEWRLRLEHPRATITPPPEEKQSADMLDEVLGALRKSGARAALAVPLYRDEEASIFVVRLVAPPLRSSPGLPHD